MQGYYCRAKVEHYIGTIQLHHKNEHFTKAITDCLRGFSLSGSTQYDFYFASSAIILAIEKGNVYGMHNGWLCDLATELSLTIRQYSMVEHSYYYLMHACGAGVKYSALVSRYVAYDRHNRSRNRELGGPPPPPNSTLNYQDTL